MKYEIYFDEWVSRIPEIRELKQAINCLCRYEPLAAHSSVRNQIEKAQKFFMKVLQERKQAYYIKMTQGERERLQLMEIMKTHEPKYQENIESRCALCGHECYINYYTNNFGRNCPLCAGEISVYPLRLYSRLSPF